MSRFSPFQPERSAFQGLPVFARLVLDLVDRIPPGRVMAYGDISEWLEQGTPRIVARVMSTYGSEASWWRVLRTDGTLAAEVRERQAPLLEDEGVVWKVRGHRVDMTTARWNPRTAAAPEQ